MLETYAVGVKLEMATNVGSVLDKLIADFDRFNVLVKETSTALSRLGRNLRADGSSMAGLDRMAEAMKAAESAGAGLTRTLRSNAEYASETARAMQASAKAMEQSGRASRSSGASSSGHGGGRFSEHNIMMGGMGAGIIGGALIGGVRYALTPAIDVARTTDVLAADMRLTPEQVQAALGVARATTQSAPGTTVGENLAGVLDLKNVFGDLGEAQKLLPEFARMTTLFEALNKRSGGTGDQSYAAAKALEIMGGMIDEHTDAQGHTVREINPELGMQRLKAMERAAVATNMRVTPSDYLGFAKQARVAGMTLSDEFTYEKLPGIMQALGGQRTGTALMSMAQVFEGGKLTDKSMGALMEIGLAGPGGLTRVGAHRGRNGRMVGGKMKVHEDAIYDLPLMSHDPQLYLAEAQKRMEAAGIHGTEAQIKALMKASQRSTIAGIFADLLKDMPSILKEQQNIRNTRPDMAEHMAAVDPAAKVIQFNAAMTNLATELGQAGMGDAMKVLDAATAGLNKLGQWAHDNPNFARIAFDAGAGLGAIATGLGALSTAILVFGPALRLLGVAGAGRSVGGAIAAGAGASFTLPGAVLAAGVAAAVDAGRDPLYGEKEKARQLAASHASAAASRALPQSSTFTPADGFNVDGTPIQMQGNIILDKQKVGTFTAGTIAKALGGTSTGTTGADTRVSPNLIGGNGD